MPPHEKPLHNAPAPKTWKHGEHPFKYLASPEVTHVDKGTIRGWTDTMETYWGLPKGHRINLAALQREDPKHQHEFEGDHPGVNTHQYEVKDFNDGHLTISRDSTWTLPNPTNGNPHGQRHGFGPTLTVKVRKSDGQIVARVGPHSID